MTDATMLALAAVAYRGVYLVGPEPFRNKRLRALMDDCMTRFSQVKDQWKIVWGPAHQSADPLGLDDLVVYIAERAGTPPALAIAIRGTNPISLSDWLFGDLIVTAVEPWKFGSAPVLGNISVSTALGLKLLECVRWDEALLTQDAPVWPAKDLAAPTKPFELPRALLSAEFAAELLMISRRLNDAPATAPRAAALVDQIATVQKRKTGSTLKQYLAMYIAKNGNCDVYVTGHSKGGALSSTVALWLTDTQGRQSDQAEQWDPDSKAALHCYSFAGPTAGDAEFAAHSDAVLKDCHRIWNCRDVVPRAFIPNDLRATSASYGLSGLEKKAIDELTDRVADAVSPCAYQHPCGPGISFDPSPLTPRPLALQIIHQHLDAYLEHYGLDNEMTAVSLLGPAL